MRRTMVALGVVLFCSGCGLMNVPMFTRLDEDTQKQADIAWHNMITPADRTDREALLGALTYFRLYEAGVDRADFHAEKMVDEKRVVMDVHLQRDKPGDDAFYVTIYGPYGQVLRSERYSREDLEALENEFRNMPVAGSMPLTPEEQARLERFNKKMLAIEAATEPVGWKPETQPATEPAQGTQQ